jgi:hypothetical protein
MASRKIQATKNYRMFSRSEDNRATDVKKHKGLMESMREYGFIPSFPIVCYRDKNGKLIVKDGQNRLEIAETLGLPVYWCEEEIDFNIAKVNSTSLTWRLQDYAHMFAKNGNAAYQEGLEFTGQNGLPIGIAFALLAGKTGYTNIKSEFVSGKFKIKDRKWAEAVAGIYVPLVALSDDIKNARFLEACMAVCRVKDFDAERLIHSAKRCRDLLVSYSTREAYLDMLQEIYNFGRSKLVDLKVSAVMAMRERNATVAAKKQKEAKAAATTAA